MGKRLDPAALASYLRAILRAGTLDAAQREARLALRLLGQDPDS